MWFGHRHRNLLCGRQRHVGRRIIQIETFDQGEPFRCIASPISGTSNGLIPLLYILEVGGCLALLTLMNGGDVSG